MEKTQTNPWRTRRRNDRDVIFQVESRAPLELSYLTRAEYAAHRARYRGRMLGAVAFGAERPRVAPPDYPYAWVHMPVLNNESMFEVWTSAQPVVRDGADGLAAARNEEVLFGCLQIKLDCRLDAASHLAYSRIFDFIDSRGYGHLMRVWNYFPRITGEADGLERYAWFNVGRHEAFAEKGRVIGADTPAACALGSRGGDLVIYFIAAREAGQLVENPRQTSAFNYPAQYGPRSPTFARARLMRTAGKPLLFVSGTASIVGHVTLHTGDAPAQARETVANIQAVIAAAQGAGLDCSGSGASLLLKAYLRHPRDLAMVRDCLTQAFGPATNVLYLQADICRADLLLEVEAVCLNEPARLFSVPAASIAAVTD
jgi:chorismate lyase/3-hydroxybenzoate synthase